MAKLGEICEIVSGSTPKTNNEELWNGDLCWITPAEITDKDVIISDTERKISEAGAKSCALTLMPIGTVLLSSRAPIGKVAITGKEMYCNQGFKNLICSELIINKYLFYFLKNNNEYLNSLGRGATFKEISKKIVADIEIPLPCLETQKQIAANLDKVTHTIDLCNAILEKLDLLVKSRFVEMFGTIHEKRFETKNITQFAAKNKNAIKRGPFGGALKKEDFVENGYLVYEQRHAIHNDFQYEKYYITKEKYEEMIGFKVVPGDLIISCSGVTLGRIAEIPYKAKEGIINQALLKLSLDQSIMMNTFFIYQFRSEEMQDILFGFSRGSGIPNMPSMSEVKSVSFICPPIELQKQFAAFVEQTDKSKSAVKQVLEKAETLKKALMQEYFG